MADEEEINEIFRLVLGCAEKLNLINLQGSSFTQTSCLPLATQACVTEEDDLNDVVKDLTGDQVYRVVFRKVLENPVHVLSFLKSVFRNSKAETVYGLERRTYSYNAIIKLLESRTIPNSSAIDNIIYFLITESDHLPTSSVAALLAG